MSEDNELFELCKEVYEKTGWEAPETYKAEDGNPENDWQAYDTDYLLEKLPQELYEETRAGRISGSKAQIRLPLVVTNVGDEWEAGYHEYEKWSAYVKDCVADTPLKALLKLTIALSEAGELK